MEFEIDHGGTASSRPYLHLTDFAGCAVKVQRLLIKETAAHLADLELDFPLVPVVSVDQRAVSLDPAPGRTRWGGCSGPRTSTPPGPSA